jgi:hypothetical protein
MLKTGCPKTRLRYSRCISVACCCRSPQDAAHVHRGFNGTVGMLHDQHRCGGCAAAGSPPKSSRVESRLLGFLPTGLVPGEPCSRTIIVQPSGFGTPGFGSGFESIALGGLESTSQSAGTSENTVPG